MWVDHAPPQLMFHFHHSNCNITAEDDRRLKIHMSPELIVLMDWIVVIVIVSSSFCLSNSLSVRRRLYICVYTNCPKQLSPPLIKHWMELYVASREILIDTHGGQTVVPRKISTDLSCNTHLKLENHLTSWAVLFLLNRMSGKYILSTAELG